MDMRQELSRFLQDYCESIRQEAELLRDQKMPGITEELFAIFENTGNRLIYEEVYFRRRKFLAVFGLKAFLDRDRQDVEKLEEVLAEICGEECWALPAHVNRKEDADWRICVDLFAAETAQTLAEIRFLLKGMLSEEIAGLVKEEVLRRVLRPFAQSQPPYRNWEYSTHNWCAVCGGSVGSAAIYLLGEEPEGQGKAGKPEGVGSQVDLERQEGQEGPRDPGEGAALEDILSRICHSLEHSYLAGFAEDGTCLEGLGYFTYGMTYFTGFAQQLRTFTAGRMDLFQNEKLGKIAAFQAKCYFQSGRTVCFADGFTSDTFRPGLTCFLAMEYPGAGIPAIKQAAGLDADNCYRWMGLYRNLIWTRQYLDWLGQEDACTKGQYGNPGKEAFKGTDAKEEVPGGDVREEKQDFTGQVVLPDAQWVICQSENGAGMAAKGGHNQEPHNHNDVGSFFYLKGEDFLLADLGCGEYTRDYFADKRYAYLCCRSLGHNVPLIDGKEQLPGMEYGCDGFEAGRACQRLAWRCKNEPGPEPEGSPGRDRWNRTVISFAKAYGNPGLESLVRTLDWNEETGVLQVEDRYQIKGKLSSIRENLVTRWKPVVQGNTIQITGEKEGCRIQVEGAPVQITCICQDFSDHGGIHREVWLLQWEVPMEGPLVQAVFRVEPF